MTLQELRNVTKCHIFVEYTDGDGTVRRMIYQGGAPDRRVSNIKITNVKLYGFVLAVELEEE